MNYETTNSYCYDNDPANCTKYGRLYTWSAAKVACPTGWHLPTKAEFKTLIDAVVLHGEGGKLLKSTSGWNKGDNDIDGNGIDVYGFSALPAGERDGSSFIKSGDYAAFWSATETNEYRSSFAYLTYDSDYASQGDFALKDENGFSVRCVKD